MSQQSVYQSVIKAKLAPIATALFTVVFVFSPSRRRLFMPRV